MHPGERTKDSSMFAGRRVEGRIFSTALLHDGDGLTGVDANNNNIAVSVAKTGSSFSAAAVGDEAHPNGLECEGDGMRKRPRRLGPQEETCDYGRNGNRNKNVIISSEEEKAAAAFKAQPGRMFNGGGGCDNVLAKQIKK